MSDDKLDMLLLSGAEIGSLQGGVSTRNKIDELVEAPPPNGESFPKGVSPRRMAASNRDVKIEFSAVREQGGLLETFVGNTHSNCPPDGTLVGRVEAVGNYFAIEICEDETDDRLQAKLDEGSAGHEFEIERLYVGDVTLVYRNGTFESEAAGTAHTNADARDETTVDTSRPETTDTRVYEPNSRGDDSGTRNADAASVCPACGETFTDAARVEFCPGCGSDI